MAHYGFWDSLVRDIRGPGMFGGSFQIRLIFQPLMAIVLGVRIGIRDAKQGKLPFGSAFRAGRGTRGALFTAAVRDVMIPLIIALIIDSILQAMINHRVRPVASIIVGALLVFLPFMIVRGLTNRLWTHGRPRGRRASASR